MQGALQKQPKFMPGDAVAAWTFKAGISQEEELQRRVIALKLAMEAANAAGSADPAGLFCDLVGVPEVMHALAQDIVAVVNTVDAKGRPGWALRCADNLTMQQCERLVVLAAWLAFKGPAISLPRASQQGVRLLLSALRTAQSVEVRALLFQNCLQLYGEDSRLFKGDTTVLLAGGLAHLLSASDIDEKTRLNGEKLLVVLLPRLLDEGGAIAAPHIKRLLEIRLERLKSIADAQQTMLADSAAKRDGSKWEQDQAHRARRRQNAECDRDTAEWMAQLYGLSVACGKPAIARWVRATLKDLKSDAAAAALVACYEHDAVQVAVAIDYRKQLADQNPAFKFRVDTYGGGPTLCA